MIQALGLQEIILMMEYSHIQNMFHKKAIKRKFKVLFLKTRAKRKSLLD